MKRKIYSIALSGLFMASTSLLKASNADTTIENSNSSASQIAELNKSQSNDDGVKGKIMISAGVGLNSSKVALALRYSNYYYSGTNSSSFISGVSGIPMLTLGADYGVARRFSVGGSIGYQYTKLNTIPDTSNVTISGTDTWTRINAAVKANYYIVAKPHANLYTGITLSDNIYKVRSTYSSQDPNYISTITSVVKPLNFGVQVHIGFSYYFNEMIGLTSEAGLGVGGPYYFAAGLGFKL